ncbi:MAG TPA: AmmeMemoRadiSam system radical SAM enzyme [Planctomycetota bacterium]|nr:AmmeMemoRadiSam system radical SAM enzyme [Planctomycetota bacterium]
MAREALLYHGDDTVAGSVVCDLCHHRCRIAAGQYGRCRARKNDDGRLMTLVYGRCMFHKPTPIESKPLLHFLPGSRTLSFCTAGCNFKCPFCQNHKSSQCLRDSDVTQPHGEDVTPQHIVEDALESNCLSVSATWTEPTVFFEYVLDAARLARAEGLAVCIVSNGNMTPEALDLILPWIDAANIDLKSFNPEVYRETPGGDLEGVLETLKRLHGAGVWVEVSTLFVPGMNDSHDEMRQIAKFIAELSADIPWHPNCAHPAYRMMDMPHDPLPLTQKAIDIGRAAGLHHVYTFEHFESDEYRETLCVHCGEVLIERARWAATAKYLTAGGDCPSCGAHCAGVWARPEAEPRDPTR